MTSKCDNDFYCCVTRKSGIKKLTVCCESEGREEGMEEEGRGRERERKEEGTRAGWKEGEWKKGWTDGRNEEQTNVQTEGR